jgi:hypothetical protein
VDGWGQKLVFSACQETKDWDMPISTGSGLNKQFSLSHIIRVYIYQPL